MNNCIRAVLSEISKKRFSTTDGIITKKDYMKYMKQYHPDKTGEDNPIFSQITGDCQKIIVGKSVADLEQMLSGWGTGTPVPAKTSKCKPTDLCSTEGGDGECYPASNVKSSLINPRLTSDMLRMYFSLMEARGLPNTSDEEYFEVKVRSMTTKWIGMTSHPLETMGSLLWRFYSKSQGIKYTSCSPDYANFARIVVSYDPPGSALKPTRTIVATGSDRDTCDKKWVDVADIWRQKRIQDINVVLSRFTRAQGQVVQQQEKGRMAAAAAMARKLEREKEDIQYDLLVGELDYLSGNIHLPTMMEHIEATVHIVFPSSVLISRPEDSLGHPNRSNKWTESVLTFLEQD